MGYPIECFRIHCLHKFSEGGNELETEIRKTAIQRYLSGEKPKTIYSDLNRSKKWFFKWLREIGDALHICSFEQVFFGSIRL